MSELSKGVVDAAQAEGILTELRQTFDRLDYQAVNEVLPVLRSARRIVCAGVGREGLTCRAFCMRLMHLGYDSHWVWDDTAPALGEGDVFFFTCGSGQIAHLLTIAQLAKDTGATVVLSLACRIAMLRVYPIMWCSFLHLCIRALAIWCRLCNPWAHYGKQRRGFCLMPSCTDCMSAIILGTRKWRPDTATMSSGL